MNTTQLISTEQFTSLRINSPVVTAYPWQTSILEVGDLCSMFHNTDLKDFLGQLMSFERHIASSSFGEGLALRQFLRFERTYAHLPSDLAHEKVQSEGIITSLSPKNKSILFNLLLTYRILDIAAVLEGHPELPLKVMRGNNFEDAAKLNNFNQLDNWPQLLFNFEQCSNFKSAHRIQNYGIPSKVRHMKILSQLVSRKGAATAFINIQLAVMNLHRIVTRRMEVANSYMDEQLQSLVNPPESPLLLNEHSLTEEEQQILGPLLAQSDKLDTPLSLALFISPLFLLVPKSLHKSRCDNVRIATIWKSLGNVRPALLARVEKELFSSLFRLATQEVDVFVEMKECMGRMPWDELREIGDGPDSSWFKPFKIANHDDQLPYAHISASPLSKLPLFTLPPPLPSDVTGSDRASTPPTENETTAMVVDSETPAYSTAHKEQSISLIDQGIVFGNSHDTNPRMQDNTYRPVCMDVDSEEEVGRSRALETEGMMENDGLGKGGLEEKDDATDQQEVIGRSGCMNEEEARDAEEKEVVCRSGPQEKRGEMDEGEEQEDRGDGRNQEMDGPTDGEEVIGQSSQVKEQTSIPYRTPTVRLLIKGPRSRLLGQGEGSMAVDVVAGAQHEIPRLHTKFPKPKPMEPRIPMFRERHLQSQPTRSSGKRRQIPSHSVGAPKKKTKTAPFNQALRDDGSSISQAIDVDKLFKQSEDLQTNLDIEDIPKKYCGEQIQGYSPNGVQFVFTPALHMQEDLVCLRAFDLAIKASFVNGRPLHVSDPANSAFCVMTEDDFEEKSVQEVQTIMRSKHIIVTDMSTQSLDFDARGLATLTTLSTVTDIQDQSIGPSPHTLSYDNLHRRGTLRNMLDSSRTGGKVLNALNFPMPEQGLDSFSFSTDAAAWNGTKGAADCGGDKSPPLGDIRWGIAATTGALHWWHLDSNGFGTYVDTKAGLKWWIVGRRKGTTHSFESFGEVDTFLHSRYQMEDPNLDIWDLEAVILHAGTRLILRPNTPHAVFTPQHAICHGGHFYSCNNMQDTMFGTVHTFIGDQALTNAEHVASRLLLRRIAFFYHDALVTKRLQDDEYERGHVPLLTDFSSVLDLFTFCNLVILMNVLDFRTYMQTPEEHGSSVSNVMEKYDLNGIPVVERYEIAYARGRCFDILQWFFTLYELYDMESGLPINGFKDVAMTHLARQASTILEYKKRALQDGLDDGSRCTAKALEYQINLCFQGQEEVLQVMATNVQASNISLAWPNAQKYGVRRLDIPLVHRSPEDFLKAGSTCADEKLFRFLNERRSFNESDGEI